MFWSAFACGFFAAIFVIVVIFSIINIILKVKAER
jgi:hypothetical protein